MVAEARREADRRKNGGGGGGPQLRDGGGRLSWPTSGYITQEYGCTGFPWEPPRGGCAHFHDGIDIANSDGTPIRAADDGVVAWVGWAPHDGSDPAYVVIVAHSGGLVTYYGHLQSRSVVQRGEYVRKGQLVGYMGNTGHSTGTHLHFEVRTGGHTVNPRSYI
jgi:murein DD-endopeptidase MepM/ murein hydrolase activator NlpD